MTNDHHRGLLRYLVVLDAGSDTHTHTSTSFFFQSYPEQREHSLGQVIKAALLMLYPQPMWGKYLDHVVSWYTPAGAFARFTRLMKNIPARSGITTMTIECRRPLLNLVRSRE